MISHYPVLESLVAFAIVFLIGFLVANSKRDDNGGATKQDVTIT